MKSRRAADRAERPHGRADAARHEADRLREELLRSLARHPGTLRARGHRPRCLLARADAVRDAHAAVRRSRDDRPGCARALADARAARGGPARTAASPAASGGSTSGSAPPIPVARSSPAAGPARRRCLVTSRPPKRPAYTRTSCGLVAPGPPTSSTSTCREHVRALGARNDVAVAVERPGRPPRGMRGSRPPTTRTESPRAAPERSRSRPAKSGGRRRSREDHGVRLDRPISSRAGAKPSRAAPGTTRRSLSRSQPCSSASTGAAHSSCGAASKRRRTPGRGCAMPPPQHAAVLELERARFREGRLEGAARRRRRRYPS